MTGEPRFLDLGEWIKQEYGDQGALASALRPKVAKNTVSSWKTGRNGIPPEYQKQLRKLGYDGPWPQEGAQEAPAPAGGPYVTEKDFAEWRGYWRGGMEGVLERLKALEDQVQKLRQQAESA